MESIGPDFIPNFGKYKGKNASIIAKDLDYCKWISSQNINPHSDMYNLLKSIEMIKNKEKKEEIGANFICTFGKHNGENAMEISKDLAYYYWMLHQNDRSSEMENLIQSIKKIRSDRNLLIYPSDESSMIYPYLTEGEHKIKKIEINPRRLGTRLHKEINMYLRDKSLPLKILPQFQAFLNFMNFHNLSLVESEFQLINNKYSGVADALFKDINGKNILIDWKFSHHIESNSDKFDEYFGLPICSYNRYGFQLHIYYQLLKEMNINVDIMLIVNFRDVGSYEVFDVNINEKWLNFIKL